MPKSDDRDPESSRLGRRVQRYAKVGTNIGGFAARAAGKRLLGGDLFSDDNARELKLVLGGLKGPLMKVAQMMASIPDLLPPEFAEELSQLQANAPPMGWVFVKRRMSAELGPDWLSRFASFEREASAAASLGQVHRARDHDGHDLACKLQYPDMQSAVEADLSQLNVIFAVHRRLDSAIDTQEMAAEIAARLREELDYEREAAHTRLYRGIFADDPMVRVPAVVEELSTRRLLTAEWLEGRKLLDFRDAPLDARNRIATAMFRAWWHPFSTHGVIHGDPHLGNYSVGADYRINLLDYGCVRIFPAQFVGGVVALYRALQEGDRDRTVAAYEQWGFRNLSNELVDTLNLWARFIYAPMLDDRVRTIADGVKPGEYGRREAFEVHQALRRHGPVRPPREFVFMDRAAIGLGGVFLHLGAELNFHDLFNSAIADFDAATLAQRQANALKEARVPRSAD